MKKKKCYISIAMEGRDIDEVKKEIEEHKTYLRKKGFIPISPFDVKEDPAATHEQHMRGNSEYIPKCDAIYIAPSRGRHRVCHAELDVETRTWHFTHEFT